VTLTTTSRRRLIPLTFALLAAWPICGCRQQGEYPDRPIVLVCPWSSGGGTDQVSRQVALLLEQELGVPVNVINATGGAGVTGHRRGALAAADGYTLTMTTVELNMLHWRGLTDIAPGNFQPVGLINRDAAALFVRTDAPWQNLEQLERHVRHNPGSLKASGTAQGGIWHLGFAGWLDRVGLDPADAIWISNNGAAPSLQELTAEGVDVVCCSIPEARSLLEGGTVRCLGVMAEERLAEFPDVPTFLEQGVDWTLTGWRGVCLPKGTPPQITRRAVEALEKVAGSKAFRSFMQNAGYDATWQGPEQFRQTLEEVDAQLGGLLAGEAFRSLRQTQFKAMFFPWVLIALLGAVFLATLLVDGWRRPTDLRPIDRRGLMRLIEAAGCVVAYVLLVETVGFIITATGLLIFLMWRLGNRLPLAAAVSVPVAVVTYQLFAVMLRVSLAQGWLGW